MDVSLSKLQEMVEGQGSLVCCSPLDCKESDNGWVTEQLVTVRLLPFVDWSVDGLGGGFRSVHIQLWLLLSAAQHVCTALWPPWPQDGSLHCSSVKLLIALLLGLLLLVSWSYELLLKCFLIRRPLFFFLLFTYLFGVAPCGILSFLTRDWTCAPCSGSTEF